MNLSNKLKVTLITSVFLASTLSIAYAQDVNTVPNQASSPYSTSDMNGNGVLAPTAPIYQLGSGSSDNNGCANGSCVLAPASGGQAPIAPASGGQAPVSNSKTFYLHSPLDPHITSVGGLVQTVIDVISYILVLFGILALVWTGLQYVLAQGNSERIKELHKTLLAIVIGIAIVIGARVIVQVVINTLKATNVINSSTLNQVQNAATGN